MAIYSYCGLPLKIFVKEQNLATKNEISHQKKYLPAETLSGESAKEFYESVISEAPTLKPKLPEKQSKSCNRSNVVRVNGTRFKSSDLHKLAQNNEFEMLERVLGNKDISIDVLDNFGWTPLMCAACNRSKEAVEVLLKNKANPYICDKFGNSAISLAKKKNFDIIEIMKVCDSSNAENPMRHEPVKKIFCVTCKSEFHSDRKTHESSTLHLFNNRPKKTRTFYGIPDCNKGFQLLLKNGWNREKGLGRKESGIKFPVKVKKKNDRIGIGGTCIENNSEAGDRMISERRMKKKIILNQGKREKLFERNYRLEFL